MASRTRRTAIADPADPAQSARAAGLRYVSDLSPGIRREMGPLAGCSSRPMARRSLTRRRSPASALAIPPAWTDVWICPSPHGHLQATGRDARGRKQYRYHPRWREVRDETKYDRDDRLRQGPARRSAPAVERDLAPAGPAREKVLADGRAAAGDDADPRRQRRVREAERLVRPDHAARPPRRGQRRHASASASAARAAVSTTIDLDDRGSPQIVRRCQDLPGQELFQYVDDDGKRRGRRLGRRQRLPARDHRRGLHRQGLPHLGRHGAGGAGACSEFEAFDSQTAGEEEHRAGDRSGGRSGWATPRPSAASATSTRP